MNDKIKALWMAHYLGQEVYTADDHLHEPPLPVLPNTLYAQADYLLLRTTDMLTDEEVKIIANYLRPSIFFSIKRYRVSIQIIWVDNYSFNLYNDTSFGFDELKPFYKQQEIVSILKAFGIIMPFTYLNESNQPVTLSPDEIVKLGWAKIKRS